MAQQIIMLELRCEMNKNDDDNDRICLVQMRKGGMQLGDTIKLGTKFLTSQNSQSNSKFEQLIPSLHPLEFPSLTFLYLDNKIDKHWQ